MKLSELKAQGSAALSGKGSKAGAGAVPDSVMTQREHPQPQPPAAATAEWMEPSGGGDEGEGIQAGGVRRRGRKTGGGGVGGEEKAKGRRQRDFDPTAATEDSEEEQSPPTSSVPQPSKEKATAAADDVWTQNQQKLLELALQQYPRGTTERWDRIAKVVPGKSKVRAGPPQSNIAGCVKTFGRPQFLSCVCTQFICIIYIVCGVMSNFETNFDEIIC